RYYSSPSNYSSVYTPSTLSSPWQTPQTPISVASVYNPATGTQVGATNINGFTTTLNNFGATSLTYHNLNSPTYAPGASFTSNSFNSNYYNNFNRTNYSTQTNNWSLWSR